MASVDSCNVKHGMTLLNGGNYVHWQAKMRAVLIRDDLWDTVSEPKPEEPTPAWTKRNNKAMAAIILGVENDQLIHLSVHKTACDMWESLKKIYARSTFGSKLYLRRKLYSIRYTSGTMRAHLNEMLEVVNLLKGTGMEFGELELVTILLCSLPESYSGLVTALEGRDESTMTIEYVSSKMLDEYQRRVESCQIKEDDAKALQSFNKSSARDNACNSSSSKCQGTKQKWKETRECYFCKKKGHIKANCRAFKKQQQSDKSADQATVCDQAVDRDRKVSFAVRESAQVTDSDVWCMDSGASSHMVRRASFFTSLRPHKSKIYLADGRSVDAVGIGTVLFNCNLQSGVVQQVELKDVLHVPKMDENLLSVKKITQYGYRVVFEDTTCIVSQKPQNGGKVVIEAALTGNLFRLKGVSAGEIARMATSSTSLRRWHRRLGHRDPAAIKRICAEELASGIVIKESSATKDCDCCIKGKLAQKPFTLSTTSTAQTMDLIHSDLCGPMPTTTPSGNRYALTFIDDHSRFTMVRLIKSKEQVAGVVKEYVAAMSNRFGRKPTTFRTDNGREYVRDDLKEYFKAEGIEHQLTVPYTPQQNGVAERKNRSLNEMAKCMLLDAGMDNRFWGEAVLTAAYLQNRLPCRSTEKTPFEHFFGTKPDISHVRVFGSKVFSLIPKEKRRKFDDKADEGILIGYDDVSKGYRILDPRTNRVWKSRSVRIIEREESEEYYQGSDSDTQPEGAQQEDESVSLPEGEKTAKNDGVDQESAGNEESQSLAPLPPQSEKSVRRSQRSNKGVPPQRICYKVTVDHVNEPVSWDEMIKLPDREKQKWISAAKEEIRSLAEHKVWELCDLPHGKQAITSKWVFKSKLDAQGQIHTHKARLVARGFSQKFGLDYDKTFAPVVKYDTIRVLFAVAAAKKLHVRQLDVKSAYLNGELNEELYLEQPQGFAESGKEDKVLRLKKSIYGLKQAARAWNCKATEVLNKLGFNRSQVDQCLYTRKESDGSVTYVLLYVDDLLVASSSSEVTSKVGRQLNAHFKTKDLGEVAHYLGIKVEREQDGSILLSQRTKIAQMLEEHGLSEPKPVSTPMETGFLSSRMDASPTMANNHRYRQAIGSLQYFATVSRPDIAVAVGFLARRVEKPTEADWKSVKRIMRYLATTIDRKLRLSAKCDLELRCYVDADWAGDKLDRKSTSGYVIQLGKSTVAWCSRKQSTVALSSTEAEYVAASHACRELLWLRQLLKDMSISVFGATTLFEDKQGCIKLVESEGCGARTKHIDVCYHQLRDLREDGTLKIVYCPTEYMVADILTKPLCKDLFEKFSTELGLQN